MFYTDDEIYVVEEPAVSADDLERIRKLAFGNMEGYLLILFDDASSNILEKTASEQLAKILQFLSVDNQDYCVLNTGSLSMINMGTLHHIFPAKRLISFGVPESKWKFLQRLPMNESCRFSQFCIVKTQSLNELNEKPSEKKLLAAALKEMFQIPL